MTTGSRYTLLAREGPSDRLTISVTVASSMTLTYLSDSSGASGNLGVFYKLANLHEREGAIYHESRHVSLWSVIDGPENPRTHIQPSRSDRNS